MISTITSNIIEKFQNKSGICVLSWIDDFDLEEKDIIAEILQLENKGVISVNEEKLIINQNYDRTSLKHSQQYILDNIQNGKLKDINKNILQQKVINDALKDGLIEEKKDFKKRKIKNIIMSFLGFIIIIIISKLFSMKINGIHIENTYILLLIFTIGIILTLILIFYPIISAISLVRITDKYKSDPYFRTENGNELNRKIEGLKKFLKDYTLLDERGKEQLVVWKEYLVYSVLFNDNKIILNQYKKYMQ